MYLPVWTINYYQSINIFNIQRKNFLPRLATCPSICLKDSHLFAARDHHHKVQTVSPSVLDLAINLFEGRTSVCSNRSSLQSRNSFSFGSRPVCQFVLKGRTITSAATTSSSQSRNSFSFGSRPVQQFVWRTNIDHLFSQQTSLKDHHQWQSIKSSFSLCSRPVHRFP